jgi:hypothetical protein
VAVTVDETSFHFGSRWREPLGAGGYVYLRHAARILPDGTPAKCLDLADVYLPERERGKGLFRAYLALLEKRMQAHPGMGALCVCDVGNQRLAAFIRARAGYKQSGPDVGPSFFLMKS